MTSTSAAVGATAPSRRASAGLAVGLVALIIVMTLTFLAFTRDDGAATPEEATQAMIAALQAGDAIGVLEQLPPGERRALRDASLELSGQLQRLGLLAPFDAGRVAGATARFDNVGWITTELDKDVRAVDLVNGNFSAQLSPGATPPLTDRSRRLLEQAGMTIDTQASTINRDFTKQPFRMVAIREGGGWHVSLGYTVAEWLRSRAGAEVPKLGKGPSAIGADSPADAVRDLLKAYANGDPERVLTLLYPDESRSIYDYAPLFLPAAKTYAARVAQDKTFDVQLNSLDVEASGSGAVRTVRVTQVDLDIRDEVKKSHVTYDGRCLHTDLRIRDGDKPFKSSDTCDGDWGREDSTARVRDNPVADLAVFGGGADLPTFVIIERNGRWFISPVRTVLDSVIDTLKQVPDDKIDVLADRVIASWKAGAGSGISGDPITGKVTSAQPTDDERRQAKAAALIERCRGVVDVPPAGASPADAARREAVVTSCLQLLVDNQRIIVEDLPSEDRSRVTAPTP